MSTVLSSICLLTERCSKMKIIEHTKKIQVVNYIRRLFRLRPEMFKDMSWDCVLRGEKLMVVRSCSKKTDDKRIVRCLLESGQIPSMLSIYLAVQKKWDVLVEADIEIPATSDVAESTPATNNIMAYNGEKRILGKKARKFLAVRYIRCLFKSRLRSSHSKIWACVIRDRRLVVVKNINVGLTDSVIMHRFLAPGEAPSWFSTYFVVRRKWHKLVRAKIELSQITHVSDHAVVAGCFPLHFKSGS